MKSTLEFIDNSINYCQSEIETDPSLAPKYTFTIDLLEEIKKRIRIENAKSV